jgi:phage head maturation protease
MTTSRDRPTFLARFELTPHELEPDGADAGPTDPILLEVPLAIPWNEAVVANGFGDLVTFEPGSLAPPTPGHVKFLLDHRPEKPFGYGAAFTATDDGLSATIAIPRAELDDPEVARAVRQMGNGVRDAVSVGVDYGDTTDTKNDDGSYTITVHSGRLVELSTVTIPRFENARHQPLVASHERGPVSTITVSPTDPNPPPDDDPPDDSAQRMAAHTATLAGLGLVVRSEPHPLARFGSLLEYSYARHHGRTIDGEPVGPLPDLKAVWVDQITGNNPGVMQPGWLNTVIGVVSTGRPFITALGGPMNPGPTGLQINWPYYDGDLMTLVGNQVAQKTEITSVRVDIKTAAQALLTFAGGSDLSYQLILRSTPAYQQLYEGMLAQAYAMVTDNFAVDAAVAASTSDVTLDPATATPAAVAAALFQASSIVQRATGAPATVVAAADDVYGKLAAAVFTMAAAPTGNVGGAAASASGLSVSLAGFSIVNVPGLAPGLAVVTNRQAGAFLEDGPRTVTAEDVPKLGRDVAIWGLGNWATFTAKGIVVLAATPPVAARKANAKSKDE